MDSQQSLINPKMITLGRELRGMTQTKLANLAPSVTQGNLSRMEKGTLNVSEKAIEEISKALKLPISFFSRKEVQTPISEFYYRKRISIPKKKLSLIEAKIDIIRMSIDELFDAVEIPEFNIPHLDPDQVGSAGEVARKVRSFFKMPRGPIKNLVRILEKHGVTILEIEANSNKFDGITVFTDKNNPLIILNLSMPNDRKIFTIAHELAHIVMHLRIRVDDKPEEIKEAEADEFTGEFLAPEIDIRPDLTRLTLGSLISLKAYWRMSMGALLYRAYNLGLITKDRRKNIYIEMSRLGYVRNEPGYVELESPVILDKVLKIYRQQLNYSEQELASMLAISEEDFREIFLGKTENIVKIKRSVLMDRKPIGEGDALFRSLDKN